MKRKKSVYGPEGGKTLICLVDDLNMPKKEEYGAQPPIELLRQYMDHKAWYIIQMGKEYTTIEDVVLLGAMGPPGGGRTYITDRLVRHFNIIGLTEMSNDQIHYIFKNVLDHFMKKLPEDIKPLLDTVISCTQEVYTRVRQTLKPIPSKTHYTFNLRDIAKVMQGVTMVSQTHVKDPESVARLWYHENMRVFHDRLTTEDDRSYFKNQLTELIENHFKVPVADLFNTEMIIYCDFMITTYSDNPDYIQVMNFVTLEEKLEQIQIAHNENCKSKDRLDLVMFFDACEHVTRITRVLRQPQGSVLLLGVGGSGRQSLTRLSAFIRNMEMKQIQVVKGYNMQRWREDLKNILSNIIEANKSVCFSFVDTQIIDEQMVEDINCLLNAGWVVGLPFSADEIEKLDNIGIRICNEPPKMPATKINIFTAQVNRIRKNLHISFAMSPLSDAFLTRMRMFPSFINCCTIDWFTEWPEEALRRVGKKEMLNEVQNEKGDGYLSLAEKLGVTPIVDKIVEMFKAIHKSVEHMSRKYRAEVNRHNYVTPRSYLEQLTLFRKILEIKNEENVRSIKRLENGIQMLKDADIEVARLNTILQEERPKLEKEKAAVEQRMKELDVDKAQAEATEKTVQKESEEAKRESDKAAELKKKVDKEFKEGQDILNASLDELNKLNRNHVNELAGYNNPQDALKTLAFAINILLEQNPANLKSYYKKDQAEMDKLNWAEFKKSSKQGNFIEQMKEVARQFDQQEKFERLDSYIFESDRKNTWELKAFANLSYAGGQLFSFINSMLGCFKIHLRNEPLRLDAERAQALSAAKEKEVAEKRRELAEVREKVRQLEESVTAKKEALRQLELTITNNELKLTRAEKLKELLKDEKQRWGNDVKTLTEEKVFIPGNCLISAGMVAYAGPFTVEYRSIMEKEWLTIMEKLELPFTENISMRKYLTNPIELMQWNVNGLPKDDTSTENGVINAYSERWPLMIDPQTQANKFIKRMMKDKGENSDTIKASQPNLMKVVEAGIHFGKTILVENVGLKLDPALEPVLLKQTTFDKSSRSKTIALGDKTITYHDSFKFVMTTTNPNPHYSPEICAKVTIINFGITMQGLIEQMLAAIVILENRKLEDSKNEIVKSNADDRRELFELENRILSSLSESQGKILEEDTIIDQLGNAKSKSTMIMQRVAESKITEAKIDESRGVYRKVAITTSILFFCIVDLATIDPMYQYSLQWFENLFKVSVDNTPQAKQIEDRLANLKKWFKESLYRNICRSMFGRHKLLFSFLMTTRLLAQEGDTDGSRLDEQAYRFLLTGPVGEVQIAKNPTNWIKPDTTWKQIFIEINGLNQTLPQFDGILRHFLEKTDEWRHIYDCAEPIKEQLPGEWETKLNLLDKILVIKAIRPDKVTTSVQDYVEKKMGKYYIEQPIAKLDECFEDSSCTIPLIFILSQGSDPKADFDAFSTTKKMIGIRSISLGQGQGETARKYIESAKTEGTWVLLQNCHLAASWMSDLEAIVEALGEQGTHKDFRLWLTSMPSSDFPISILQNSVKMTIEPPQGIKDNLKKSYESMNKEEINDKEVNHLFKRLLYGLCFFHAIIQDRRKFGPIGWNIAYEFTYEDLDVCKKQLKLFLTKAEKMDDIPFEVIRTLCADINYGGRVTDKKDARLIQSIINKFISKEMLTDGYDFTTPSDGYYVSPPPGTHQDYLDFIQKLPHNANPEIFGLHPNAAITYALNQTRTLLESLLSIQPRDTGSSSDSRNSSISATTNMVLSKTPPTFDLEKVKSIYRPDDYNESMNSVLIQELIRFNRLLEVMVAKLKDLQLAIKGEVVMSEDLEKIADSFYVLQVPKDWSYPLGFLSLKGLNAWIEELNQRVNFFNTWIKEGQPKSFWFGGFFFPQAFITGTLQNFARKNLISIDQLNFEYEIRQDLDFSTCKEQPETGVYVYGIFLEGARWDERMKHLGHSKPKELYSTLPMLHLKPIAGEENKVALSYVDQHVRVPALQGRLKSRNPEHNGPLDELRYGHPAQDQRQRRLEHLDQRWSGCLFVTKIISIIRITEPGTMIHSYRAVLKIS
jgi:dynein heavy chain